MAQVEQKVEVIDLTKGEFAKRRELLPERVLLTGPALAEMFIGSEGEHIKQILEYTKLPQKIRDEKERVVITFKGQKRAFRPERVYRHLKWSCTRSTILAFVEHFGWEIRAECPGVQEGEVALVNAEFKKRCAGNSQRNLKYVYDTFEIPLAEDTSETHLIRSFQGRTIHFYKRMNGPSRIWVVSLQDFPFVLQASKVRQRERIKGLQKDEIALTQLGLGGEGIENHAKRLKIFMKELKLPKKARGSGSVTRSKWGQELKLFRRKNGTRTVWAMKRAQFAKIREDFRHLGKAESDRKRIKKPKLKKRTNTPPKKTLIENRRLVCKRLQCKPIQKDEVFIKLSELRPFTAGISDEKFLEVKTVLKSKDLNELTEDSIEFRRRNGSFRLVLRENAKGYADYAVQLDELPALLKSFEILLREDVLDLAEGETPLSPIGLSKLLLLRGRGDTYRSAIQKLKIPKSEVVDGLTFVAKYQGRFIGFEKRRVKREVIWILKEDSYKAFSRLYGTDLYDDLAMLQQDEIVSHPIRINEVLLPTGEELVILFDKLFSPSAEQKKYITPARLRKLSISIRRLQSGDTALAFPQTNLKFLRPVRDYDSQFKGNENYPPVMEALPLLQKFFTKQFLFHGNVFEDIKEEMQLPEPSKATGLTWTKNIKRKEFEFELGMRSFLTWFADPMCQRRLQRRYPLFPRDALIEAAPNEMEISETSLPKYFLGKGDELFAKISALLRLPKRLNSKLVHTRIIGSDTVTVWRRRNHDSSGWYVQKIWLPLLAEEAKTPLRPVRPSKSNLEEVKEDEIAVSANWMSSDFQGRAEKLVTELKKIANLPEARFIREAKLVRVVEGVQITFYRRISKDGSHYIWAFKKRHKKLIAKALKTSLKDSSILDTQRNEVRLTDSGLGEYLVGNRTSLSRKVRTVLNLPIAKKAKTNTLIRDIDGKKFIVYRRMYQNKLVWVIKKKDLPILAKKMDIALRVPLKEPQSSDVVITIENFNNLFLAGTSAVHKLRERYNLPDPNKSKASKITRVIRGKEITFEKRLISPKRVWTFPREYLSTIVEDLKLEYKEKSFSEMTLRELEEFSAANGISHILGTTRSSVAFVELLDSLHPLVFAGRSSVEFAKAYLAQSEDKERHVREYAPPSDIYFSNLLKAFQQYGELPADEVQLARHKRLIKRSHRPSIILSGGADYQELDRSIQKLQELLEQRPSDGSIRQLIRTHEEVRRYFEECFDTRIEGMKNSPLPHQYEAIQFLVSHKRALLADSPGSGKTYAAFAAALQLDLKKNLYICPASNLSRVKDNFLRHVDLPEDALMVIDNRGVQGREELLTRLRENPPQFILVSLDTLRSRFGLDRELFRTITENLDSCTIDEGQYVDNEKALRSKVVKGIEAKYVWITSALPYQGKFERFFHVLNILDPTNFPSLVAFRLLISTQSGQHQFRCLLDELMLRRELRDFVPYFDSPDDIDYSKQLAFHAPRIAKRERTVPIRPELSASQCELMFGLMTDFKATASLCNPQLLKHGQYIPVREKPDKFRLFNYLWKVIYQPKLFGLRHYFDMNKCVDTLVHDSMKNGEKVALWGFNTEMLDHFAKRYKRYGAVKLDGSVRNRARDEAIEKSQNDPRCRVLVGSYAVGGVGLELHATERVILLQLPHQFPVVYQLEGRFERPVMEDELHLAHERYSVTKIVPTYSTRFLKTLRAPGHKTLASHGTIIEQIDKRHKAGEFVFQLFFEGYFPSESSEMFNLLDDSLSLKSLVIGEKEENVAPSAAHQLGSDQDGLQASARDFTPLFSKFEGDDERERELLRLLRCTVGRKSLRGSLVSALLEIPTVSAEELSNLNRMLRVRHQVIRSLLEDRIQEVLTGKKEDSNSFRTLLLSSPEQILVNDTFNGKMGGEWRTLANEVAHSANEKQRELFRLGVSWLEGVVEERTKEYLNLDSLRNGPIEDRIQRVFRLGLLARFGATELFEIENSLQSLIKASLGDAQSFLCRAVSAVVKVEETKIRELIKQDPSWSVTLETILFLYTRVEPIGYKKAKSQFSEIFGPIINAALQGERDPVAPFHPSFREKSNAFWETFRFNDKFVVRGQELDLSSVYAPLQARVKALVSDVRRDRKNVEGPLAAQICDTYRHLSGAGMKREFYRDCLHDQEVLRGLEEKKRLTKRDFEVHEELLDRIGIRTSKQLTLESLIQQNRELEGALDWLKLAEAFPAKRQRDFSAEEFNTLCKVLKDKSATYRAQGRYEHATRISSVADEVRSLESRLKSQQKFTVQETRDCQTILSLIFPTEKNGFRTTDGLRQKTAQFVLGLLGSPNIKVIVIRNENGTIAASALLKLRRLPGSSKPVITYEIIKQGPKWNFQQEFDTLLRLKKRRFDEAGIPVVLARSVSEPSDTTLETESTGLYTPLEYFAHDGSVRPWKGAVTWDEPFEDDEL